MNVSRYSLYLEYLSMDKQTKKTWILVQQLQKMRSIIMPTHTYRMKITCFIGHLHYKSSQSTSSCLSLSLVEGLTWTVRNRDMKKLSNILRSPSCWMVKPESVRIFRPPFQHSSPYHCLGNCQENEWRSKNTRKQDYLKLVSHRGKPPRIEDQPLLYLRCFHLHFLFLQDLWGSS